MKSHEKIVLAAFLLSMTTLPCYADTATKTTTTTTVTTIREDAPIYMGAVREVELQELTLTDFQQISANPSSAAWLFSEYQRELNQPKPNATVVPYKMRITDRDLTLADFQGANVSPDLAQARYKEYLRMNPIPVDGAAVRYVFVYHTPLPRIAA